MMDEMSRDVISNSRLASCCGCCCCIIVGRGRDGTAGDSSRRSPRRRQTPRTTAQLAAAAATAHSDWRNIVSTAACAGMDGLGKRCRPAMTDQLSPLYGSRTARPRGYLTMPGAAATSRRQWQHGNCRTDLAACTIWWIWTNELASE